MSRRPVRIAILDDDPSVRSALLRLLNISGMCAVPHASSAALLKSLEQEMPDCLLLDLLMPGMDGTDVMSQIARLGIRVPIIVITAVDGPVSMEACLAAGISAYLRKPLDADKLIEAIDSAILKSPGAHGRTMPEVHPNPTQ